MPKSTDTCNKFLNLLYRAAAWANVADNAASSPYANTYAGLHTGNLTAGTNSQAENETAYTNYARVAVARSTGWNAAAGGATQNAAQIQFPQCGASGATLSHVSVGPVASGSNAVKYDVPNNTTIDQAGAWALQPKVTIAGKEYRGKTAYIEVRRLFG